MVMFILRSGVYTNTYTNTVGCDSTHTLVLTINYSNTFEEVITSVIVIFGMARRIIKAARIRMFRPMNWVV